jgi:hypothetical protein
MVREVCATSSHHLLRRGDRIAKLRERTGDAHPPQLACRGCLDGRRLDPCADTTAHQQGKATDDQAEHQNDEDRKRHAKLVQ